MLSALTARSPLLPCPGGWAGPQVWKGKEVLHLGYFENEEDAARAYDAEVLRIRWTGSRLLTCKAWLGSCFGLRAAAGSPSSAP